MSKPHRLQTNIAFSLTNVLLGAVFQFITYRLLLKQLGTHQFGIWALTISVASLGRLGELGFNQALVKLISEKLGLDARKEWVATFQTGFLTVLVLCLLSSVLLWVLAPFALSYVTKPEIATSAIALLPETLAGLVFAASLLALTSLFDAKQIFAFSSLVQLGGQILFLSLLIKRPDYDLKTVAEFYLLQNAVTFIVAAIVATYLEKGIVSRSKIGLNNFNEILRFTTPLFSTQILQLVYEPAIKLIISRFSGIEMVGFFEIANRLAVRVRQIVVSINGVLLPVFSANLPEMEKFRVYKKAEEVTVFVTIAMFSGLIGLSPLLVWLIGSGWNSFFSNVVMMVSAGWLIATLNLASYNLFLGFGRLQPILAAVYAMFGGGLFLALLFSYFGIFYGPIIGWVASMVLNSWILVRKADVFAGASIMSTVRENPGWLITNVAAIAAYIYISNTMKPDKNVIWTLAILLLVSLTAIYNFYRSTKNSIFLEQYQKIVPQKFKYLLL